MKAQGKQFMVIASRLEAAALQLQSVASMSTVFLVVYKVNTRFQRLWLLVSKLSVLLLLLWTLLLFGLIVDLIE